VLEQFDVVGCPRDPEQSRLDSRTGQADNRGEIVIPHLSAGNQLEPKPVAEELDGAPDVCDSEARVMGTGNPCHSSVLVRADVAGPESSPQEGAVPGTSTQTLARRLGSTYGQALVLSSRPCTIGG